MPAPLTRLKTPEHSARLRVERKASWARIKAGDGFIYTAAFGDQVKIGFSLDPAARLYEIGGGLIAQIPGTHRQEMAIHAALKAHAIMGDGGWGKRRPRPTEYYPRSILTHEAIPAGLRVSA